MNLGKWALANSKLVYYMVAILVVGGVLSYKQMSKLEDPVIKITQAMVVTTYPGASPYEVELEVSEPLERAIYSMKGIDYVESSSYADLSIVSVKLLASTPDKEVEQQWDMLRRKVNDVQSKLPSGATTSVVVDSYGDVYGMFYALTSDGFTNRELSDYANFIKRELQLVEGVSKVELYGEYVPTIEVSISEEKMANLGVSPTEVLMTLQGQNKSVYSGYYVSGEQRVRVAVNDKYKTVRDIATLVIQGHEDDQMTLSEIATVTEKYAEPRRNSMYYDMQPAIGISVSALEGTDIIKVGKSVEALLSELKETRLPVGVECNKVFYQPERVSDAIRTFLLNLLSSVVIVVVVLMFAMGFRSGVLLGVTLVVTVVGSILFLNFFDGTLQRVSLATFILAMGMLVDNAIVVVDGIRADMSRGRLRTKALTDIGNRTAMPLLGATFVAILAFFPVFLSPDTAGVYVRDLFVVLTVSLLLSWVLSLTMVPLQARAMLKNEKIKSKKEEGFMYRALRVTLKWSLRHKSFLSASAVVLVALSAYVYTLLPQSFFPDMNYDQLYIEYKLPEGSTSERTRRDLDSIASYLLKRDDVRHVTTSVGATPSRYNLVRTIATPSLSYGDVIVDFVSEEALLESIDGLNTYFKEYYPEAVTRVKRYNLMFRKAPIEVLFSGPDPAVLHELTQQAISIMESNANVLLTSSDWDAKVGVLELDYNQAMARASGLSRQDVGMSILASTDGIPTDTFFEGARRESVVVKCVNSSGEQIDMLSGAPVFPMVPSLASIDTDMIKGLVTGSSDKGELISSVLATKPLTQAVAGINVVWEDPVVVRYKGRRAMRAQANPMPNVGAEAVRKELVKEIEAIELPEGYTMQWEGEYSMKNESVKSLFSNLPIAIVLMIGILIMLFKDYRKPIIIVLCVPLLFVGAVLGVWIGGYAFGFVAICGVLGLIGMMIKNGVVLMDEISLQMKSGKSSVDAIIDSSVVRFSPVMLASLTTILGMLPLLPDGMFGALAATIMGGLLFGTVVTLIYIPVFYAVFFKIKTKK